MYLIKLNIQTNRKNVSKKYSVWRLNKLEINKRKRNNLKENYYNIQINKLMIIYIKCNFVSCFWIPHSLQLFMLFSLYCWELFCFIPFVLVTKFKIKLPIFETIRIFGSDNGFMWCTSIKFKIEPKHTCW